MHGGEIGRIVGVDEDPRGDEHVVGVEPVDGELVIAGTVDHLVDVVVVVDDHHRQVAVTGIGQRQGRSFGDVDDRAAVQGVAVLADHRLLVDRRWLAVMHDNVDRGTRRQRREHPVGLGADEVVDIDLGCHRAILARMERGGGGTPHRRSGLDRVS